MTCIFIFSCLAVQPQNSFISCLVTGVFYRLTINQKCTVFNVLYLVRIYNINHSQLDSAFSSCVLIKISQIPFNIFFSDPKLYHISNSFKYDLLFFTNFLCFIICFLVFRIAKCGCHIKRMHYLKKFIQNIK